MVKEEVIVIDCGNNLIQQFLQEEEEVRSAPND
jgi:hypothetical protein